MSFEVLKAALKINKRKNVSSGNAKVISAHSLCATLKPCQPSLRLTTELALL